MKYTKGKNSFLVSFEGIEGAGKSTQIESFKKQLLQEGYQVHQLREPGGTQIGEQLRSAILNSPDKLSPLTEAFIFVAARNELLNQKILPILKNDKQVVILDRYMDSSVAYQGHARGLGADKILELHKDFPLNIRPDLTFYLRISVETSLKRQAIRGQNKDYFEKENTQFYQKLVNGFEYMHRLEAERVIALNAEQTVAEVSAQMLQKWQEYQSNHG